MDPLRFDPATQAWAPAPATEEAAPERLVLVTWNVWFGELAWQERSRALLAALRAADADVIALQEVTRPLLELLLAEPWVREGYAASDATGETLGYYGVLLLSRAPLRAVSLRPLPSEMERKLLVGELAVPGGLRVATAHLESLRPGAALREEQLALIQPALLSEGPDFVLAGDFNFGDGWPEEKGLSKELVDVWRALRPKEKGATLDAGRNAMLGWISSPKAPPQRFDRVLLRSEQGAWKAESIELLGTEPVAPGRPDIFPSDHFGLRAVIRRSAPPG